MSEYENRAKRLKLKELAIVADKKKMDSEKKSNFSSISPSNGAIVRGGSGSANVKGDVKKLVIKNFRGVFNFFVLSINFRSVKNLQQNTTKMLHATCIFIGSLVSLSSSTNTA